MISTELYSLLNNFIECQDSNFKGKTENYQDKIIDIIDIEDDIQSHFFFYFFPIIELCDEKNSDVFWFEKYFDKNKYTEYNFAIDLLTIIINYRKNKSVEMFYSDINKKIQNFKDYKNIGYFSEIVPKRFFFKWLVKYLTKNTDYFEAKDGSKKWEAQVEFITVRKFLPILLQENIQEKEELKLLVQTKDKENKELVTKIKKETNESITKMKEEIKNLTERIDKIELRDTIKLTIQYLYNVLHNKFNPTKKKEKEYRSQINEIKSILNRDEFNKYQYLKDYLDDIDFGIINNLNLETHSKKKEREISHIEKIQEFCNSDVSKVIEFFKKFPEIDLFINLHLTYFVDPETAEKRFGEKVQYSDAYDIIFNGNN